MNAVEIEEAISGLAQEPFDGQEFPFAFLEAFGNKATTIKRLRSGQSNKSDIGGVLQTNNIHILTCPEGKVGQAMAQLKASPATAKAKAKYVLATDGITLEAEELNSNEAPIACNYEDFPDHFGFFLPLAGISTVKQIKESSFDIKATGRLNRLYVELLKDNKDWDTDEQRPEMNHFMARLIFCFFAEDTGIFKSTNLFTQAIEQMSERDASNTHQIISEIFRAMDCKRSDREKNDIPRYANEFPYVNGSLFSGSVGVPKFSKIARSYLLNIGRLDWKKVNPDIFGSMIQAVADDEERGALGMHYTSVPNILKVLNPLFLDDLREQLDKAGENPRKLLNLRSRMAKIRVFDPACGSGNFLVIAYKEMRAIEYEVNKRRDELDNGTVIPITNFRGIELRDFPAEIARLALIIAEYQCDVLYLGQKKALAEFLPLDAQNWITCGNALRLDWLSICPPTGTEVQSCADDLLIQPVDQAQIDFENEGGETYICGNPPYLGSKRQSKEQKSEMKQIFEGKTEGWRNLDYVAGWFAKAAEYGRYTTTYSGFVSTNSICQGQQVAALWPYIFSLGAEIGFAHLSFKWRNLASNNAGVTVVIVGLGRHIGQKRIFETASSGETSERLVTLINPYLVSGPLNIVKSQRNQISKLPEVDRGNSPTDGGNLILDPDEVRREFPTEKIRKKYLRRFVGSAEIINGSQRYCLWINDDDLVEAQRISTIRYRMESVQQFRLQSSKASTVKAAGWPHRFDERKPLPNFPIICIPVTSSEERDYLPVDLFPSYTVASNAAFSLSAQELWVFSLFASRMLRTWVAAVCSRLELRLRFTNTVGWNTFSVPKLTKKNKKDLTHCAEDILLAREAHFPATIADLYDPDKMPADLRAAHDRNDEVLERIYIGRRFKNDTERLEKLFELYTKMTTNKSAQNDSTGGVAE